MNYFIKYILIAMGAISLQASALFHSTRPDVILVVVIFFALRKGQLQGTAYGALTGFMLDLTGGHVLGPNIISKAIAGYCAPLIKEKLFQWNIIANTLLVLIFSVIDLTIVFLCLYTIAGMAFANVPGYIVLKHVSYTTLAGMILYIPFNPEPSHENVSPVKF